jgi:AcrR family transcriptional regulator
VNRNQLRKLETLDKLFAAAEETFVRDGYEGAQLDRIAAAAGRTKGALYSHFQSKEDLFLTLFRRRTEDYIGRFKQRIEDCADRRERMDAFRKFYVECVKDTEWSILTLEFRLFALRHPGSEQKLQRVLEQTLPFNDERLFVRVFGELMPSQRRDFELALVALGPILSGLVLEAHFEPLKLSASNIRRVLEKMFDMLFAQGEQ